MTAFLDWRKHSTGPLRPCVRCGQPALMRDTNGQPCHRVCAEAHLTVTPATTTGWEIEAA